MTEFLLVGIMLEKFELLWVKTCNQQIYTFTFSLPSEDGAIGKGV
jgi:hypothetical protein